MAIGHLTCSISCQSCQISCCVQVAVVATCSAVLHSCYLFGSYSLAACVALWSAVLLQKAAVFTAAVIALWLSIRSSCVAVPVTGLPILTAILQEDQLS